MKKKNATNRRDLNRTKTRILDAAAREFAKHGLPGARVDIIAAKAGVNKALIYYIFKSKEDLYLAVLEALFEEKTKNIDLRLPMQNLSKSDFLLMLQEYFEAFLARQDYAHILLHDVITGGNFLRRLQKKRPDLFEIFDAISKMVRASIKQGMIREINEDKGVILLIIIVSSLTCLLPHMDLVRPKGSSVYSDLSDPDQWKIFLADLLERIVQIPRV